MDHRRTVLVVTGDDDETTDAVVAQLGRRGVTVFRTDIANFPQRLRLTAVLASEGRWTGQLVTPTASLDLDRVRSGYYRRPNHFAFPPQMSPADALLAAAEARHGLGGTLAALDVLWVNDPSRAARAEYKPLQLKAAVDAGLDVPPTLVTNDYPSAVEFADAYGPIVCKPLSSLVLGDRDGHPLITYTTRVDVTAIDPAQFITTTNLLQRWVPKEVDCRVTVVGPRPFAVAVRSSSGAGHVDWRTDYSSLTYSPVEVPDDVVTGIARYLDAFGLHFAAFDFGIDLDGRWWFYEANPSGEWLWIEAETGLGISAALADLLVLGGEP